MRGSTAISAACGRPGLRLAAGELLVDLRDAVAQALPARCAAGAGRASCRRRRPRPSSARRGTRSSTLLADVVDEVRRFVFERARDDASGSARRASAASARDEAARRPSRCSTTLRRSRARSGLRNGESRDGDWIMPGDRRRFGQRAGCSRPCRRRCAPPRRTPWISNGPRWPSVDVVQVQLEDLLLREAALEHERHELLLQLAPQRLLRRQEHVLDDLLRQRAAADQIRLARRADW